MFRSPIFYCLVLLSLANTVSARAGARALRVRACVRWRALACADSLPGGPNVVYLFQVYIRLKDTSERNCSILLLTFGACLGLNVERAKLDGYLTVLLVKLSSNQLI